MQSLPHISLALAPARGGDSPDMTGTRLDLGGDSPDMTGTRLDLGGDSLASVGN